MVTREQLESLHREVKTYLDEKPEARSILCSLGAMLGNWPNVTNKTWQKVRKQCEQLLSTRGQPIKPPILSSLPSGQVHLSPPGAALDVQLLADGLARQVGTRLPELIVALDKRLDREGLYRLLELQAAESACQMGLR